MPPRAWLIVWLMFLATLINYMDRQALGSASPYIKAEFKLSEEQVGRLEFAFGLSFAVVQVVAGWLADRFSIRAIYLGALLLWSAAGFATGFASAFESLLWCRVLLGIGEAFNWPCAVTTVRRVVPRESRSLANGVFHSGATAGAVLTPLLAVALIAEGGAGWRNLFLVVGSLGIVWAVLWVWGTWGERGAAIDRPPVPDPAGAGGSAADAERSLASVFTLRTFWLALAAGCCVNLCWHFLRFWYGRYLDAGLGIKGDRFQWLLVGFFAAADVGSLLAGWATRRLTRGGMSVERSRKWVSTAAASCCLLTLPALRLGDSWGAVALFYAVAAGSMGGFANYFAMSQDVSGRHTGLVLGVIGATGWFLIAPLHPMVGAYFDEHKTFAPIFVAFSVVPLLGAAAGWAWPERGAVNG